MPIIIRNIEQLTKQLNVLPTDLLAFRRPTAIGATKDYAILVSDLLTIIASMVPPQPAAPPVIVNVTSNYTVVQTTGTIIILVDTTSGTVNVSLLTAVGNTSVVTVKKTSADSNHVIVTAHGAETIDDATTAVLQVKDESITMVSDDVSSYKII